jgi:hypothetical protein
MKLAGAATIDYYERLLPLRNLERSMLDLEGAGQPLSYSVYP